MARWLIFPLFIGEVKAIIRLLKDKEAPKRHKLVVILGLIYLFSPIDLIPFPIIGLNLIDDIVIWAVILWYLKEPLSKYKDKNNNGTRSGKSGKTGKKYDGKTVINVEDYIIVDENKEKQDNEQQ